MSYKFKTIVASALLFGSLGCSIGVQASCPPREVSRAELLDLKAKKFQLDDSAKVQSLALRLVPCLAHPDPELRDGVAFEALSMWMRGKKISANTAIELRTALLAQLDKPDDRPGFAKPFAALVLAEVARMDRVEPYLTAEQRAEFARKAAAYLRTIRDYRGFDEKQGWRHGVAHGADLLMQLGLNANVGKSALDENLAAIATQVAPAGHTYVYGEPARLASAVFWTAQRNLHSTEEWADWFKGLTNPAPFGSWRESFSSQAGLTKRHDTLSFLQSLYVLVQENGNANTKERVLPPLKKSLETVW